MTCREPSDNFIRIYIVGSILTIVLCSLLIKFYPNDMGIVFILFGLPVITLVVAHALDHIGGVQNVSRRMD